MGEQNNIDKLFKDKLENRHFEFKEAYWQKFRESYPGNNSPSGGASDGGAGIGGGASFMGSSFMKLFSMILIGSMFTAAYFAYDNQQELEAGDLSSSISNPTTESTSLTNNVSPAEQDEKSADDKLSSIEEDLQTGNFSIKNGPSGNSKTNASQKINKVGNEDKIRARQLNENSFGKTDTKDTENSGFTSSEEPAASAAAKQSGKKTISNDEMNEELQSSEIYGSRKANTSQSIVDSEKETNDVSAQGNVTGDKFKSSEFSESAKKTENEDNRSSERHEILASVNTADRPAANLRETAANESSGQLTDSPDGDSYPSTDNSNGTDSQPKNFSSGFAEKASQPSYLAFNTLEPFGMEYSRGRIMNPLSMVPFSDLPDDIFLKRKRFFLAFSAGPSVTFNALSGNSTNELSKRKRDESPLLSYEMNLEVGYLFNDHWSLSSGLNHFQFGESANYKEENTQIPQVTDNSFWAYYATGIGNLVYTDSIFVTHPSPQFVYTDYNWLGNIDSIYIESYDTFYQQSSIGAVERKNRIKYIEIPLQVSYLKDFNRFYIRGSLGTGLGLMIKSNVRYPSYSDRDYVVAESENFRKIMVNLNTAFETGYRIRSNTYITAAVQYRKALISAEKNTDVYRSRYSNLAARLGLSFRF